MRRFVPYTNYFEKAKNLASLQKKIFFLTTILSIIIPIFNLTFKWLNSLTTLISLFTIPLLFILNYIVKYYQDKGETSRRNDFWDNSFGSKLSDKPSIKYYSNDNLSFGLEKALYNVFENTFHSLKTVEKMLFKSFIEVIFFGFILFIFAIIGFFNNNLSTTILQLFLSKYIIEDYLNLRSYKKNLENIKNMIQEVLSLNLDNLTFQNKIIHILITYESNLSQYSILLDSKIFLENNDSVSKEWEDLKKRYPIKEGVTNDCK